MPLMQSSKGVVRENLRGGTGKTTIYSLPIPDESGRVVFAARIELEPGASIGIHRHDDDEETYAIQSGEGMYEHDGGSSAARPGDIFLTRRGMSHGLRNTGEGDLVFFAVMAK